MSIYEQAKAELTVEEEAACVRSMKQLIVEKQRLELKYDKEISKIQRLIDYLEAKEPDAVRDAVNHERMINGYGN